MQGAPDKRLFTSTLIRILHVYSCAVGTGPSPSYLFIILGKLRCKCKHKAFCGVVNSFHQCAGGQVCFRKESEGGRVLALLYLFKRWGETQDAVCKCLAFIASASLFLCQWRTISILAKLQGGFSCSPGLDCRVMAVPFRTLFPEEKCWVLSSFAPCSPEKSIMHLLEVLVGWPFF